MLKRCITFVLCAAFLFLSVSCKRDKIYSHAELVIPLSEDFYATADPSFDASYSNGELSLAILRISFAAGVMSGIPETLEPKAFARYWLLQNEREAEIIKRGDYAICDYMDGDMFYLAAFFRSKNAYFVLLFATLGSLEAEWRDRMLEFTDGVYFTA